jgi:hypothetical protein
VVKPELPGLGGWADVTAVTGNPVKRTYTDATGVSWTSYEWDGNGSLTCTAGLLDIFAIGAGGEWVSSMGARPGGGGRWLRGPMLFTAATHTVTVGLHVASMGNSSIIGPAKTAIVGPSGQDGAGRGITNTTDPYVGIMDDRATGTPVEYGNAKGAAAHPLNSGHGGWSDHTAGASGVVIIRVPAAHAKA